MMESAKEKGKSKKTRPPSFYQQVDNRIVWYGARPKGKQELQETIPQGLYAQIEHELTENTELWSISSEPDEAQRLEYVLSILDGLVTSGYQPTEFSIYPYPEEQVTLLLGPLKSG